MSAATHSNVNALPRNRRRNSLTRIGGALLAVTMLISTGCATSGTTPIVLSPVSEGGENLVTGIEITHSTDGRINSDTDGYYEFIIGLNGTDEFLYSMFPDLEHDERERGTTDTYTFVVDPAEKVRFSDIDTSDVNMIVARHTPHQRLRGQNAWQPSSFEVVVILADGSRKVIASRDNWPDNKWFSTEYSDAKGEAYHQWNLAE